MTEKPAQKTLRKPHFIKVKDLQEGRSGYNVYVKIMKAEPRTIETKDGQKIPMVDCVVGDETGSAKAFFKGDNANDIKEGAVVAIRNGVRKIIKGHISLEVDIFGRVTVETQTVNATGDANISEKEIDLKKERFSQRRTGSRFQNNRSGPRGPRRNDREGNGRRENNRRPPRNDRDYNRGEDTRKGDKERAPRKFQENNTRGQRKPLSKINEIDPGAEELRFVAKVISATLVAGRNGRPDNYRCVLGDETGVVNAFLNQSEHLQVGKSVILTGAISKVVKEHIQIQKGKIDAARRPVERVNEKFNLSEKSWVPID